MKTHKRISAALAAVLTACSLTVLPLPSAAAQSLWSDGGSSYNVFADRKARQVGDILTIVISESTTLSATKSSSNSKSGNTSLSAGVGIFDFLKAASASGSDSFKASGSSTSKNTTTGNVTVTVVDVQPNGNMTVEGTQSIWQNRNEHKITFRGYAVRMTLRSTIRSRRRRSPMRRSSLMARGRLTPNSVRAS